MMYGRREVGFITKSDSHFFDGLLALLASLRVWHSGYETTVVDSGLTASQRRTLARCPGVRVCEGRLSDFHIPPSMQHYYTPAIYGFFSVHDDLYPISIHIDADAVVLAPLDELLQTVLTADPGLCAVPDYPKLTLAYQLGDLEGAAKALESVVPDVDMASLSFNGGVFAVRAEYYQLHLRDTVMQLLPLHELFWGNDMAILNFAAYAANRRTPFLALDHVFNCRHHYRRAPHLKPSRWIGSGPNGLPVLEGPFGPIRILHFVGRAKPWKSSSETCASVKAWRAYRDLAARWYE